MVEIKVPSPGESVTEGILSRWLKPNGSFVKLDEPVFELESDKAAIEVNAPASGVLTAAVPEGSTVKIGAVVGRIDEKRQGPGRRAEQPAPDDRTAGTRTCRVSRGSKNRRGCRRRRGNNHRQRTRRNRVERGRSRRGHAAGALGTQYSVPSTQYSVPSTQYSTFRPHRAVQRDGVRETRQQMSTIRQRIAERLVAAQQTAAILTTFNEADLSAVLALRTKYKESFQKKHGVGLGFMGFFVKACCEALRTFPAVNAFLDGSDVIYHHYVDVGVAVSTEKGLMVPVLRNADRLTFAQIEKGIADLAAKARDGKITVSDLQGGTFTITNGGVFGSLLSTPILNPPQSGILGMHTIQKRAVVVDDQIVIRPMMYLAVSYDHRIIDGREAVGFLVRVKECIENPERLLLEV